MLDKSIKLIHTYSMKTAISIPDDMFEQVNSYAAEHKCSRSEVFARAMADFLERRRNAKLLAEINEVYGSPDASEDTSIKTAVKKRFKQSVLAKEPEY